MVIYRFSLQHVAPLTVELSIFSAQVAEANPVPGATGWGGKLRRFFFQRPLGTFFRGRCFFFFRSKKKDSKLASWLSFEEKSNLSRSLAKNTKEHQKAKNTSQIFASC